MSNEPFSLPPAELDIMERLLCERGTSSFVPAVFIKDSPETPIIEPESCQRADNTLRRSLPNG